MVRLSGHFDDEADRRAQRIEADRTYDLTLPPEASIQQDPHQHKRYQLATQASQARRERDARRRTRLRHQQLASVPLALLGLVMEGWLVVQQQPWLHWWVLPVGVLLCCPAFAAFRK